jgi:hypothetical protein
MFLIDLFLKAVGYTPDTKWKAIAALIIAPIVIIVSFIFVDFFVTTSILISLLFPLFVLYYFCLNTTSNSIISLYKNYQLNKKLNAAVNTKADSKTSNPVESGVVTAKAKTEKAKADTVELPILI